MEISELAKFTTSSDKKLTSEIHGCDYSLVDKVLRGTRKNEAIERTLRVIVEEREKLKAKLLNMRKMQTDNQEAQA